MSVLTVGPSRFIITQFVLEVLYEMVSQDTQVLNLSLDVAAYDIFVESQDQHINKCHQNSAITFFLCLSRKITNANI